MAGMRELSKHILHVADQYTLPVTNLKLQKVMFFSLGFHISKGIDYLARTTYNESFEKWQFGPVVPSVYYSYNYYRDRQIQDSGEKSLDYGDWDTTILPLLRQNAFYLVKVSHSLNSWANYKDDILNRSYVPPYTLEEIYEDFKNDHK